MIHSLKKTVDHVLPHHVAMNTFDKLFAISQLCMTPSSASTDQLYSVYYIEIETLNLSSLIKIARSNPTTCLKGHFAMV